MGNIHSQSREAFIEKFLQLKKKPPFDEICYRMLVSVGWPIETVCDVLRTVCKVRNKPFYKHHSDTAKIKAASLRHRDYLRSQLTK